MVSATAAENPLTKTMVAVNAAGVAPGRSEVEAAATVRVKSGVGGVGCWVVAPPELQPERCASGNNVRVASNTRGQEVFMMGSQKLDMRGRSTDRSMRTLLRRRSRSRTDPWEHFAPLVCSRWLMPSGEFQKKSCEIVQFHTRAAKQLQGHHQNSNVQGYRTESPAGRPQVVRS